MKALLVTMGSRGDLYPFLALGEALRACGHDVALLTTPDFQADVETAGLQYVELLSPDDLAHVSEFLVRVGQAGKQRGDRRILDIMVSMPRRIYDAVQSRAVPGDTVLLTSELFTMGAGRTVQDSLGIPYVSVWHAPSLFKLANPVLPGFARPLEDGLKNLALRVLPAMPAYRRSVDELRAELGLPREPSFVRGLLYSQRMNLCLYPQAFTGPTVRMRHTLFTGFPQYEPPVPMPPALDAFLDAGDPPVVFTTASWRADAETYYRASLQACVDLGLRAVMIGGKVPQDVADSPQVCAQAFVPMQTLLRRSRAIVHHGGIGSVAAALATSTPQLVVPQTGDQPRNASIVRRLGFGLSVPDRRYAAEATPALKRLLESDEIQRNVKERAAVIGAPADFREAIDAVEGLLRVPA